MWFKTFHKYSIPLANFCYLTLSLLAGIIKCFKYLPLSHSLSSSSFYHSPLPLSLHLSLFFLIKNKNKSVSLLILLLHYLHGTANKTHEPTTSSSNSVTFFLVFLCFFFPLGFFEMNHPLFKPNHLLFLNSHLCKMLQCLYKSKFKHKNTFKLLIEFVVASHYFLEPKFLIFIGIWWVRLFSNNCIIFAETIKERILRYEQT